MHEVFRRQLYNGVGAKGLRCSALDGGQPAPGGTSWIEQSRSTFRNGRSGKPTKGSEPTKVRLAWTANRLRTSRLICRTTSTRSGIGCRLAATFRRRCDGLTSRRERLEERGRLVFQRSPTESPRWWSNGFWSHSWSLISMTTAMDTGPANRRSMLWASRGSDAGATPGSLISTSRPSLTVSRQICLCEQFVNIRTARGCCCTLRDG